MTDAAGKDAHASRRRLPPAPQHEVRDTDPHPEERPAGPRLEGSSSASADRFLPPRLYRGRAWHAWLWLAAEVGGIVLLLTFLLAADPPPWLSEAALWGLGMTSVMAWLLPMVFYKRHPVEDDVAAVLALPVRPMNGLLDRVVTVRDAGDGWVVLGEIRREPRHPGRPMAIMIGGMLLVVGVWAGLTETIGLPFHAGAIAFVGIHVSLRAAVRPALVR